MSQTLLRFGLWIIMSVLAGYVLRETFAQGQLRELLNPELLQNIGAVGVLMLVLGGVMRLVEKIFGKKRNRCAICGQRILPGEIYCRADLRRILAEEDERNRSMNRGPARK